MAELSGRAGDWLGWRRTIDFTLRGQAWGEGAGVLRRWREKESGAGLAWAGSQRGGARAQARASLRPGAWGTEVTRSREPVVTAGVGGVPCARVRGSGLGLWGSWTTPPPPPRRVPGTGLGAASAQLHWKQAGKTLLHQGRRVRSPRHGVRPSIPAWPMPAGGACPGPTKQDKVQPSS